MTLLNQDVKSFVLDCDKIATKTPPPESGGTPRFKYLVGGLPRTEVEQVSAAMAGQKSVDDALAQAQQYAEVVGKSYQEK